jgi:DNA-binding transcriptional LysR family regulator
LASAGTHDTLDALRRHRWLNYRQPWSGRLLPWEFSRDGEEMAISVEGALTTNDPDLLVAAALDGAGLACITEATIIEHLNAGRLIRVLDEWCAPFSRMDLVLSAQSPHGSARTCARRLLLQESC